MAAEKWVLLDMDGVVTSEDGYRRATACALLDFAAYLGHPSAREAVFGADSDALPWRRPPELSAHAAAQNALVNTNWDQCHLAALVLLGRVCAYDPANQGRLLRVTWQTDIAGEELRWPPRLEPDVGKLLREGIAAGAGKLGFELLEELSAGLGEAAALGARKGVVWQWLYRHFQCWFVGTEAAAEYGLAVTNFPKRPGIIRGEVLVLEPGVLAETFRALAGKGWMLGIATGRPRAELVPTLSRFGLWEFFAPRSVTTHDEIIHAEQSLAAQGITVHLSKPHPFPFLRSIFPAVTTERLLAVEDWRVDGRVVIVGDTAGDMKAAAAIGATAVGVLTGAAGEAAAAALTRAGAQYILPDVSFLPELLDA